MEVGSYWNGWEAIELLGEGSFGRVFKIVKREFGHNYLSALKVLKIPQSSAQYDSMVSELGNEKSVQDYFYSLIESFANECALMARLSGHTNIVSYYDHIIEPHRNGFGWTVYIRMEYLTSIQEYFKSEELSQVDVINLGIAICKAMEIYSRYNIIHRDIKPSNVLVNELGDFKLADFGVARIVESANTALSKKGTYNYMAPEVFKMQSYDITVDIYSLGIMMYRYLNHNRLPLLPSYPEQISFQSIETANFERLTGKPFNKPQEASDELSAIILKACAYNPRDRYQHPTEMLKDLEEVAIHLISSSMQMKNQVTESVQYKENKTSYNDSMTKDHGLVLTNKNDIKNHLTDRFAFGNAFVIYLKEDGTIISQGIEGIDKKQWCDIVAVTAGPFHALALRKDGTVLTAGYVPEREKIAQWKNIISIAAGFSFSVGLQEDGHVVIAGNKSQGRSQLEEWENIVAISAGYHYIIGLKNNGKVVAAGPSAYAWKVYGWKDIVAISAGTQYALGLRNDGTVVTTGARDEEWKKTEKWDNIIAIAAGENHAIGLKENGKVVGIGYNGNNQLTGLNNWHDIISIAVGKKQSIGMTTRGDITLEGDISGFNLDF